MKYLVLLLISCMCVGCNDEESTGETTGQTQTTVTTTESSGEDALISDAELNRMMQRTVEDMRSAGNITIEETASLDPSTFEIEVKTDENGTEYYRLGQLILLKPKSHSVFLLYRNGEEFADVVTQKDWSPRIDFRPDIGFSTSLLPLEEGVWLLSTFGGDPEFIEQYIITRDKVVPVNAEVYLQYFAFNKGVEAAFEAMGESMLNEFGVDGEEVE